MSALQILDGRIHPFKVFYCGHPELLVAQKRGQVLLFATTSPITENVNPYCLVHIDETRRDEAAKSGGPTCKLIRASLLSSA